MTRKEFSAPGRIEIGGNHTDHQHGPVLTAAIDLYTRCTAEPNGTEFVIIESKGFDSFKIDLRDLAVRDNERGTPAALVRGVASWFAANGYSIGGFDATISSDIPAGKGLSSSAAFEVLIGRTFAGLFGAGVSPLEIALAARYAENTYFGKPCGFMDQVASSFGGCMMIDFSDPKNPVIDPVNADLSGYSICVVAADDSHADLTGEYTAITSEMAGIARYFGKEVLRDVCEDEFYKSICELRKSGDRPVLRAIHFFEDSRRVEEQFTALRSGNISGFLDLVNESGRSSVACLQNIYSSDNPGRQGLMLALALAEQVLGGRGACRVHGGGFAGTILAFVPDDLTEEFSARMTPVFGEGCCYYLTIGD